MKTLNTYINEWKLTDDSNVEYVVNKYFPETYEELRQIVIDKYEDVLTQHGKYLDLRDINVSKINTLGDYRSTSPYSGYGLFYKFSEIEIIDTTGWNTKNVTDCRCLFDACYKLKEIRGIDTWDVSNVKIFSYMFNDCYSLTKLDLSKWKLKSVEEMDSMFSGCKNLRQIKNDWNINTSIVSMQDTFDGCKSLKKGPSWRI